jgi:signal transduction histidine kinase
VGGVAVRLTARGRLAILLTGLVLAAGAVLTALTYVLVRRSMSHRWTTYIIDPTGPARPPVDVDRLVPQAGTLRADTLRQLLTQAGIALAVVTLLAAVLGWLLAGRILQPVRDITAAARRLSAENLAARVPTPAPPDELAELARTVNGMLDRIEAGVAERDRLLDSQRRFVANAAHELRTPLATMRAAIDVTLDGDPDRDELRTMAADIRTAVDRSRRTLDGLLTLARSQAGLRDRQPTDLAELAGPVCARFAAAAEVDGIAVHQELRPAPVHGEPVLLAVLIGNLVDNAVRYNRPGGQVSVHTGTADGAAVLRVANTGEPIPPDRAAALLEPFVRGPAEGRARPGGSGLGLSIARAIVLAHGGQLIPRSRPDGGLEVSVWIPPAAHPPALAGSAGEASAQTSRAGARPESTGTGQVGQLGSCPWG